MDTTSPSSRRANRDVLPDRKLRGPRFGRTAKIVLAIVAGMLLVGSAGVAYAAYDHARDYEERLLPGTTIAGIELGGLDRAQALEIVAGAIRPQLDRRVDVTWEKRSWSTTPRELGARNDAETAVDGALTAARAASFLDRVKMKVLGSPFHYERDVAITFPRKGIRGFVAGIAAGLDRDARDATVDYSSGWVEIVHDRQGRKVLAKKSRRVLLGALRTGASEVALAVKPLKPEVSSERFEQVILVRIGENKLYLYEDGEITHSWPVATGLPEYATPTGLYEVTLKRYLPTWVNPAPDTWGKDMPAEIPPGPGNPLGVRALNWDAPAIRFHGTTAEYSLGYNASHGCVRMSNDDVIELYDLIDVGTPIVSTVVASLRPLYASAPDPTVVAENAGDESPSTKPDQERKSGGRRG